MFSPNLQSFGALPKGSLAGTYSDDYLPSQTHHEQRGAYADKDRPLRSEEDIRGSDEDSDEVYA